MADFLLFLGKLNLAMGAAIIIVWLLRRPLRAQFGATIAYALWLLVPMAGLASLLPPRTEAPLPAYVMHLQNPAGQYSAAHMPATMPIAQLAPRVPEQLTEQIAPVQSMISAQTASFDAASLDYATLLFAVWVLGAVLMALYLARLQLRFHATMRLGKAGPAVLGFLRPRVVTPDNFQEQFTVLERAAIMAHERVHLERQDARINALVALLRSLCWFNPLVHLGAALMRIDQELACDAMALVGPVSRRDYAKALLKSQMMVAALPLGCNWPGSQHPLIERIALLKRKRPGAARRIIGTGLVVFAATFAGLGAWAAQPPVPGKIAAAPHTNSQVALVEASAMTPTPGEDAGNAGPNQPVADANPIGKKPLSAALIEAQPLPSPKDASAPDMALNAPPAAPSPAATVALDDHPAMQPAAPDLSVAPVQAQLNSPAAMPAKASSNELPASQPCNNTSVYGRAISSEAIQMQGFTCLTGPNFGDEIRRNVDQTVRFGSCPLASMFGDQPPFVPVRPDTGSLLHARAPCPFDVSMNVQLADPADAAKMQSDKLVRLTGNFSVASEHGTTYLNVTNARVIWVDPFGAGQPATKSSDAMPDQPGRSGMAGRETASVPPGQIGAIQYGTPDPSAGQVAAATPVAPSHGVRPDVAQPLSRAEELFKRGEQVAAMKVLMTVEAEPDLNRDEKRRVAIVRSFITPYSAFNQSGAGDNPFFQVGPKSGPTGLGPDSYLPPGDVGPNDPNR